jgi:uncharacterized protein YdgA (DUF945 family)
MSRRVTLVVTCAALLGALVVAPPVWVGARIARAYAAWVDRADGSAAGLHVEGALDRGLWHSTARTTLHLTDGEQTRTIVLHHWISHGPVPLAEGLRGRSPFVLAAAVVETRVGADPDTLPRISAALGGQSLVRVVAWLGLDESVRVEAVSPAFRLEDGDVHSAGARASLSVGPGAGPTDVRIEIGPLGLRDGNSRLSLGGGRIVLHVDDPGRHGAVSLDVDLEPSSLVGPAGAIETGAARARLTTEAPGRDDAPRHLSIGLDEAVLRGADPSADALRVGELALSQVGGADPATGLHAFETGIRFATLEAGGEVYGPGVAKIALRRIDATAFRDVRAALAALSTDDAGGDAGQEAAPAARAVVAAAIARLLAARPEIDVESVSVHTPTGAIEGRGRVVLAGGAGSTATPPGQGATVLDGLSATADLSVPAPWLAAALDAELVEQVRAEMGGASEAELAEAAAFVREAVLARLVEQGLLEPEGGRYRAHVRIADGTVSVNGRGLDPAALGGANALP